MPVPSAAFQEGDVFIDFPQEDVMFRFVHRTRQVFCRFYDQANETETDRGSDLYAQARLIGVLTTAERYFSGLG